MAGSAVHGKMTPRRHHRYLMNSPPPDPRPAERDAALRRRRRLLTAALAGTGIGVAAVAGVAATTIPGYSDAATPSQVAAGRGGVVGGRDGGAAAPDSAAQGQPAPQDQPADPNTGNGDALGGPVQAPQLYPGGGGPPQAATGGSGH